MIEPVSHEVVVALPLARAFQRFTQELDEWWPREYTWSQDVLEAIGIEPRLDGMCFEIGPHGFRCDWGRVIEWEPPARIRLAWQISPRREPVPDPRRASELTVRFTVDESDHTRVGLLHEAFEHHGDDAAAYRAAMASPQGWPLILKRFVDSAGE